MHFGEQFNLKIIFLLGEKKLVSNLVDKITVYTNSSDTSYICNATDAKNLCVFNFLRSANIPSNRGMKGNLYSKANWTQQATFGKKKV